MSGCAAGAPRTRYVARVPLLITSQYCSPRQCRPERNHTQPPQRTLNTTKSGLQPPMGMSFRNSSGTSASSICEKGEKRRREQSRVKGGGEGNCAGVQEGYNECVSHRVALDSLHGALEFRKDLAVYWLNHLPATARKRQTDARARVWGKCSGRSKVDYRYAKNSRAWRTHKRDELHA